MKKRLLKLSSLILSLAMVLSLFSAVSICIKAESNVIYVDSTVDADDASTNTYKTLATAVSNAAAGDTIVFKSDYNLTGTDTNVTITTANITIDLGNKTFTINSAKGQGLYIKANGIVVQNGRIELDPSKTSPATAQYFGIFNYSCNSLTVKNITFELLAMPGKSGDQDTNPGALLRCYSTATNTTNVYNCSFICSCTGTATYSSLVACSTTAMNFYNCTFDGNGVFSGIQVRGNSSSPSAQYGRVGIYNCDLNNVNYLFSKSTNKPSVIDSQITFYGATVNNAAALCAEPDNVTITEAEHATMPDLTTLTAPYTFEVACAHNYVDGVCEYCNAPETAVKIPEIKMDDGAAMRIDGKTNGIRFSATVDKSALDGFGYEITDAGMLVAKEGYASTDTLTVDNSVPVTSKGQTIADGKAVAARYNGATLETAENEGKYIIYGSLVEIDESNANQNYVARAFIEYTGADGKTAYLYSDLSDARSIAFVAKELQTKGDGYYGSLCDTHKKVVSDWADNYIG